MTKSNKHEALVTATYIIGFVLVATSVVFATLYLSGKYLNKNELDQTANCESLKVKHTVTIQDDRMNPEHTDSTLCDTLTITNLDSKFRLISFGKHERHIAYDGITEKGLKQNESITVTLNKAGEFLFHDHNQDEVQGEFTVNP